MELNFFKCHQKHRIVSQVFDAGKVEHVVVVQVIDQPHRYSLLVTVQCDQDWKKQTSHQKPQSHLVLMRTRPAYKVQYGDHVLDSRSVIRAQLADVQGRKWNNARIVQVDRNVYQFVE